MPIRIRAAWPLLALAAFLVLAALVIGGYQPLRDADSLISERIRAYGTENPQVIAVIRVLTNVMGTYAFLTIGLAATLLLGRERRRAAAFCAAVTVAVPVLWSVMHAMLHRPRPVGGFVSVDSNGFPSGHTSHATATALVGLMLLWPRLSRTWRGPGLALGVAFAAGIGLTRVVLLAHWPSDVVGGALLALAVVPLLARVFLGGPPSGAASGSDAASGSSARPVEG